MKRLTFPLILAVLLLAAANASAEDFDWRAEMKQDLVTMEGGKMKTSKIEVCEIEGTKKSIQMHWKGTAPASGLISRDYFVSTVSMLRTVFMAEMAHRSGVKPTKALEKMDCTPRQEPIGKVDITVTMTMTNGGIQMEVATADGTTKRTTSTWDQVFGE